MRVAYLVRVEGRVREQPREVARGPCVIQVYVRQEDPLNVFGGDPVVLQTSGKVLDAARGAGLY